MKLFVTCPKGIEVLLADELKELLEHPLEHPLKADCQPERDCQDDDKAVKQDDFQRQGADEDPVQAQNQASNSLPARHMKATSAGVTIEASLAEAYHICLKSRLANRVLLPLSSDSVESEQSLYDAVYAIDWHLHIPNDGTLAVDFIGTNHAIKNSQYGAVRVKDAVVDKIRDVSGIRPSVEKHHPDVRINVRLAKGKVHIAIDLSGDSLHRRGYRRQQGAAPLKENLAAAILIRAGWPEVVREQGGLIDPMCGSATFLIEAVMMALNIAPGIFRKRFGFEGWLQHDAAAWGGIKAEAVAHRAQVLASRSSLPEIRGYDANPHVIAKAEENIEASGLTPFIRLIVKPITAFKKPTHTKTQAGLLICNPPYGERLGEVNQLRETYETLARVCKQECPGWRLAVFTGNALLAKSMRLRPDKKYKLMNGSIASELLLYQLLSAEEATWRTDAHDEKRGNVEEGADEGSIETNDQRSPANPWAKSAGAIAAETQEPEALSAGAQMVANRLKKNQKRLAKWLKQLPSNCYRLYDADMPEYAAAIDIYGDKVHIQEYAAPKNIDKADAKRRFNELCLATKTALDVTDADVSIKVRRRNKGKEQYEKNEAASIQYHIVEEGQAKLAVNLDTYLDSGLFLDHRPLRLRLANETLRKRFLNLFCYTATATVHAALGGAASSVSVDMSRSYLDWARYNFQLNNLNEKSHRLEQADCFQWLAKCREGFDVIMLDPPTFSNSKRMDDVLDVQRDHVRLITRCMEILNPNGVLYFSNNLRTFSLDDALVTKFKIENITRETIDKDFERNQKIHHCFRIMRR